MKNNSITYNYLKEIVYGGTDGIITTFAVVAGFNGAQLNSIYLPYMAVLLFGFANLFADATSMGIGSFLSERSEFKKKKHNNLKIPLLKSIATFSSFILFGIIPIIPYILYIQTGTFEKSIMFTIFALILLATIRWKTTKEKMISAYGEILILGCLSATVAFIVGTLFRS